VFYTSDSSERPVNMGQRKNLYSCKHHKHTQISISMTSVKGSTTLYCRKLAGGARTVGHLGEPTHVVIITWQRRWVRSWGLRVSRLGGLQSGLAYSIAPGKGPESRWTADHAYSKALPQSSPADRPKDTLIPTDAWTVEERNWLWLRKTIKILVKIVGIEVSGTILVSL
jgi:hypothetical protein